MAMQTAHDIPMLVRSINSSSERRISPAWTIKQFKARLEPITGISASSQKLFLRLGGSQQQPIPIEAPDEDATTLSGWALQPYAEIYVGLHWVVSVMSCMRLNSAPTSFKTCDTLTVTIVIVA